MYKVYYFEKGKMLSQEVSKKEGEDSLRFYYRVIDCDLIDVVGIGDIGLIVDDEGLMKSGNLVYKVMYEGEMVGHFAGNLLFEGDSSELRKIEVTLSGHVW